MFSKLPVKTDEVVFCPLSSTQIAVYKRILDMHEVQNMIRKDDDCDCGSNKKSVLGSSILSLRLSHAVISDVKPVAIVL
jgi:SNF2 family DNA or RNA helicase